MCGFIGLVDLENQRNINHIRNSCNSLKHRGPDGSGYAHIDLKEKNINHYINSNEFTDEFFKKEKFGNILLGHRRLSIVDLSEKAHQPLISEDNKNILIFNGEIFNHRVLRRELEKSMNFRTHHSDSEVLLNGLIKEGPNFVEKCNGQFSFAFVNLIDNTITLGRDRIGQKPLYYAIINDVLYFSSTLESLCESLEQKVSISEDSFIEYLHTGSVSSPNTIFQEIKKLMPSELRIYSLSNLKDMKSLIYWQPENFVDNKKFNQEEFNEILKIATKQRLDVDVRSGFLLSGGLDSTAIVKSSYDLGEKIKTFCIGFDNSEFDESIWAKKVSNKFKTDHSETILSSEINFKLIEDSFDAYDEPFADSTSVPTFLLTKEISTYLKVALSGDGGDELLSGYLRYSWADYYNKIPTLLRPFSNFTSKVLLNMLSPQKGTGQMVSMGLKDPRERYAAFFEDSNFLTYLGLKKPEVTFSDKYMNNDFDLIKSMQIADYKFYLPEVMMVKVDRASMKNSLELRSPFVDHNLIEYVLGVESNYYYKTNNSKLPLKNYLQNDFEDSFINRKKQGFGVPVTDWLLNDIDKPKEKSIINTFLISENSFTYARFSIQIKELIDMLGKNKSSARRIWRLISFEIWFKKYKKYI